jgi:hypothetical protein
VDRLREIFRSLWGKIEAALKNFENSSLFERIMRRYESMSPRGQGLFKWILKTGVLMVIAFLIVGGPLILLSKLARIKQLEKLESSALVFQAEYDSLTKGYTPPVGWRPLDAGSAAQLASAFNEYLPGIGVPEEFGTLVATGDTLNLTLREISIRQATNIIFQLEALYPKLKATALTARPNAGRRDIMDMEATFKFNPAFANQFSGAAPGGYDQGEAEEQIVHGPSGKTPPGKGGTGGKGTAPHNGGSDFQSDYVPPPPPPGGEYDDLAPPDIPDDLPPPPPPPGFEEEP